MITFEQDGRTYRWYGGFGAIFISYERGLTCGDVRMINNEIFYVYTVNDGLWWFRKPKVCWSQPQIDSDKLRILKRNMLGLSYD
jgi:hypothetical protein